MFYSNKSSILVSGEGNSSRSKMNSFMRILNLQRIVFLMCIVSSGDITWGMEENEEDEIKVIKLGSEEEYDLNYKVVFLGDTKVGKTQIINQHVKSSFEDKSSPTIGFDFMSKKYNRTINERNKIIRLQIWDTTGNETYRSLVQPFVKNADAIVLVYDVTQKKSFDNIKKYWLGLAKKYTPNCKNYFLVGNKTDLEYDSEFQADEAKKYAEENNKMRFFEVSAKENNNLDKLFEDIVKECLEKDKIIKDAISDDELEDTETNPLTQSTTQTKNKPCICCSCCPCNK